jgi:hypothetical protein
VLVVSLPDDSAYAPLQQFVIPFEHLADCPGVVPCTCSMPDCGHLPAFGNVSGGYLMTTSIQSQTSAAGLGFFLGNVDSNGFTAATFLPVHATYRMLVDQFGTDIESLGLSLQPVQGIQTNVTGAVAALGPNGARPVGFSANLPGGTYERTLSPDPDYDVTFGPEVRDKASVPVNVTAGFETVTPGDVPSGLFDVTREETIIGHATLPTFDIDISAVARREGWSAFLRDATTRRVISNVSPLTGAVTTGVRLVTNHLKALPPGVPLCPISGALTPDALTNAELVVAPPDGAPLPAAVFAPQGCIMTAAPAYPQLAPPVVVQGTVSSGGPFAADLTFEAVAFVDQASATYRYFSSDFCASCSGERLEFVAHTTAVPAGGTSSFQVTLPQGLYRVDIVPRGGAGAISVSRLDVMGPVRRDFVVPPQTEVAGSARLTDERPLGMATIEAIPQSCPTAADLADAGLAVELTPNDSPWCLPRPVQVISQADGSFKLALDPGGYTLRARPADGTHLPWAQQTINVGGVVRAPKLVVPAPFHATFKLLAPNENPIVRTVVQAFFATPPLTAPRAPTLPPAVEIGQAFTGSDGTVDLYMTLP